MSALFTWPERTARPSNQIGDRRTVTRFLLWPRCLDGEWRWLGFEEIVQEFQRYRVQPPEMRAMDVVGWRPIAWGRTHDRMMEIRRLAAKMWREDGGHMPYQNGGVIFQFMVQHPDTRIEYEKRAEAMLDAP